MAINYVIQSLIEEIVDKTLPTKYNKDDSTVFIYHDPYGKKVLVLKKTFIDNIYNIYVYDECLPDEYATFADGIFHKVENLTKSETNATIIERLQKYLKEL